MARNSISFTTASTNVPENLDYQIHKKAPQPGIPVVSAVLHVISMTVVVFLRRRFGYSYLQYISTFVAITWGLLIFTGFAWASRNENTVWQHHKWLILFTTTSLVLFFIHLAIAYFGVYLRINPHDHEAGKSWLETGNPSDPAITHLLIEPLFVFSAGAVFYFISAETVMLGLWLFIAAIAMSIKESINSFHHERKLQQTSDALLDAERNMRHNPYQKKAPRRSVRKTKPRKPSFQKQNHSVPQPPASHDDELAIHYADIIGLEPPYDFKSAQKAYRRKLKELHPDGNLSDDSEISEDTPQFSELRKALHFFKTYNL